MVSYILLVAIGMMLLFCINTLGKLQKTKLKSINIEKVVFSFFGVFIIILFVNVLVLFVFAYGVA